MKLHSTLSVGIAAALLSLSAFSAQAVTASREVVTNAAGICQSALPAFDGLIRKRPLALQNEGTTNAFVTCAFSSQYRLTDVYFYGQSNDGTAHSLSCTGVTSYATGSNEYVTKTVALAADGSQSFVEWTPADFAGAPAEIPDGLLSVSCSLEPGVALNDTYVDFDEDVGA